LVWPADEPSTGLLAKQVKTGRTRVSFGWTHVRYPETGSLEYEKRETSFFWRLISTMRCVCHRRGTSPTSRSLCRVFCLRST